MRAAAVPTVLMRTGSLRASISRSRHRPRSPTSHFCPIDRAWIGRRVTSLSAEGQGGPMNPSHKQPRKKRGRSFSLESLEDRQLLSAGMGSTFAIMPGSVATAGQVSSVQFKIDPSQFTPAGGQDRPGHRRRRRLPARRRSSPQIVSVKNASGRRSPQGPVTPMYTAHDRQGQRSWPTPDQLGRPGHAARAQGRPGAGDLHGAGQGQLTGRPATTWSASTCRATSTATARSTQTDLQTIKSELGSTPTARRSTPSTPTPTATARSPSPTCRSPRRTWG